ncbi:unnamed protein product [Adineta steineri]|uniref:Uncharacterized protein n=1 Tax=Adineta steineri TaxID=433720 RepID=A0A819MLJ1_9BILA|nr:unnamed protein product [Adineta steineri]CAF3703144.1 unnamed protein product [Adineta steineri]CAF3981153.1 unnamed protein product [Adineta steineri]
MSSLIKKRTCAKSQENRTQFFKLIKKTGSVVTCASDGLKVDNKTDISPERYNEIGKAVFQDKVQERLDNITNLPPGDRKEAMKNLERKALYGDYCIWSNEFFGKVNNAIEEYGLGDLSSKELEDKIKLLNKEFLEKLAKV